MLKTLATALRAPASLRLNRPGITRQTPFRYNRHSSTSVTTALPQGSFASSNTSHFQQPASSASSDDTLIESRHVDWNTYVALLGHDLPKEYARLVHEGYDASWEAFLRNHKTHDSRPSREFKLALKMIGHLPEHDIVNRSQLREGERGYLQDFRKGCHIPYEQWCHWRYAKRGEKISAARSKDKPTEASVDWPIPPDAPPTRRRRICGISDLSAGSPDDDPGKWTWLTIKKKPKLKTISWTFRIYNGTERLGIARTYIDCTDWPEGTSKRVRPVFDEEVKAVKIVTIDGETLPYISYPESMAMAKGLQPLLQLCVLNGHLSPDQVPVEMHVPSLDLQTNLDNRFYAEILVHPRKITYDPEEEASIARRVWVLCNFPNNLQQGFFLLKFRIDPSNPSLERTPDGQIRLLVVPYVHPSDHTLRFYDVRAKEDLPIIRRSASHPSGYTSSEVAAKWPELFKWANSLGCWEQIPLLKI